MLSVNVVVLVSVGFERSIARVLERVRRAER
jgi:hypothetical protein